MSEPAIGKMSFEDAIRELEGVVNQLEDPDVALEESIRLYERGEALKRHCDAKLRAAEERVVQIELGRDGTPEALKPVKDQ